MNPEQSVVPTRLRTPWQAIDLGIVCARHWYWPLLISWLLPAAVTLLSLNILLSTHPFASLFIVWFLKPFWDRLPLFYASRALFAAPPSTRDLLRQLVKIYRLDCLPWLTWRRFSLRRSFILPVTLLEGLRGSAREKRAQVLSADNSSAPIWLTMVFLHLEQLFPPALLVLLIMLVPEWQDIPYRELWSNYESGPVWQWLACWLSLLSMAAMAPFYVCGGFMAYINRRIDLEGWDIEIRLRALAARVRQPASSAALALVFLLGLASLGSERALAEQPGRSYSPAQAQARAEILDVVASEDLTAQRTVGRWQLKNRDEADTPDWLIALAEWLAELFTPADTDAALVQALAWWARLVLIVAVGALSLYLLYRLARSAGLIDWRFARPPRSAPAKPEVVMGMSVKPQSLPANVSDEALALLAQGDIQNALRLLYRASLSRLIHRFDVPLQASQTELECATTVQRKLNREPVVGYFHNLTQTWLQLSYAHRPITSAQAKALCQNWHSVFEPARAEAEP